MRIRWTPSAVADLQQISDYLKKNHPRYRQPTMLKIYEDIRALKQWPQRGRPGLDGTRELSFSPLPYLAIYRVKQNQFVEVLRVYHAAQDRSDRFLQ